jgi:hypothetical protein
MDFLFKEIELSNLADLMGNNSLDTIGMSFQKSEKREKIWDFSEYLYQVSFNSFNVI